MPLFFLTMCRRYSEMQKTGNGQKWLMLEVQDKGDYE